MKKSSFIAVLVIFILPLALYYFLKMPEGNNSSAANASMNTPRVIKFTSTMCYDCKRIQSEINPLMGQYSGKVTFESINVSSRDQRTNSLIQRYNVTVVPTLVFLDKNGATKYRIEGYIPQSQIKGYLDAISVK